MQQQARACVTGGSRKTLPYQHLAVAMRNIAAADFIIASLQWIGNHEAAGCVAVAELGHDFSQPLPPDGAIGAEAFDAARFGQRVGQIIEEAVEHVVFACHEYCVGANSGDRFYGPVTHCRAIGRSRSPGRPS